MVKGLVAGLAGLSAAVAIFQLQGDGGSGSAGAGGAPEADAGIPDRRDGPDAAAALTPAASADAGGSGVAHAPAQDAPLRSPARPEGGPGPVYVGDAPGRLRADADAGTVAGGAPDAGSAGRAAEPDAGTSGDEVRRLRERVASLEQELARTRSDGQAQEIDRLKQQVASLREQLAQEQGRRQQDELATQQARAREQEATSALARAQQQLAAGDSRALDTLESVSSSLPAPAQSAVQSARSAVRNGDLAAARYWLSVALAEEQRRQVTR